MVNGKGTARETELLAAVDVAELIGVKETTIYRWCKEGKLPCLKVGKHWRVRRGALEDFLRRSEHPTTLVGQLSSFLQVPDNVLAITQNVDLMHRLDVAYFQVGDAHGGILVKFYGGEDAPADELRAEFEKNGLEVGRLDLETALEQQKRLTELVDARHLVVKTAAIEEAIDDWPASVLRRAQSSHSATILFSEDRLSLSRATPMPPS